MEEIRTEQQSGGIAIGKAVLLKQPDLAAERREITAAEAEKEQAAFRRAAEQVREALRPLARTNAIFAAHLDMAEDATLLQGVEEKIAAGKNAEWALEEETEELSGMLESLEDAYLRERAADVRDVCRRIMAALKGVSETSLRDITEKAILFAEELHPSDTAQMDFRYIRGMVTEKGGATSHVAILARSLEIPALLGVEGILKKVREGEAVILDGKEGRLIFSPDAKTQAAYQEKQQAEKEVKRKLKEMNRLPAATTDGRQVALFANAGSLRDIELAKKHGAEGIGLFRSEFLYLERETFPTEEEQFQIYRTVAETMAGKPVIIRTLDIGADKKCDYFEMEPEENPAMGCRAIRICLTRPEIFKTQLRALFRASAFGNISIMYPMIISVEEVHRIKEIVAEVKQELTEQGVSFGEPKQGIMIETPAAVMMSAELAKEVDFFSIGTNDLTQYTLAIDRQNPKLDAFYDPHHPAVLRMIQMVVENAHKAGIWAGICGELGADQTLTRRFLAMGVDELSMSPGSILPVRKIILETDVTKERENNNLC